MLLGFVFSIYMFIFWAVHWRTQSKHWLQCGASSGSVWCL